MECFAGVATVGAGAKTAFDYNRENFMYDREQRMKMEFALQKFRVAQASLWREDVRDLISLSEYKMHIYLLVNVLLLGFTIVLWCEGRLPSDTPDWLMMGSAVSITGAFMFLLLSIWLAMHAAVAAQSYETRLLTQLVRLPIPSWQEIEACRTYGSDFERTGAKQIFRVPFFAGRQEGLVTTIPEATPEESFQASPLAAPGTGAAARPGSPRSGRGPPYGEAPAARAADPWGYERSGEDIDELGCHHGSQVAKLRHIRLARQAMVYWQSYDAFSRISLSIGINQLLLALSYYMLGYILVEVGCRTSATYGVVLLCVLAEAMAKLDMSLSIWQLRQIQFLLAFGPIMSLVASYRWTMHSWESYWFAETLIVASFLSHGILLALMIRFCVIKPQENGTMLPTAFRGVLYLDVFGWLKASQAEPSGLWRSPPLTTSNRGMHGSGAGAAAPSAPPDAEGADAGGRPALETVSASGRRTIPRRPEDLAPQGYVQDLRDVPGAPQPSQASGVRSAGEPYSKFYDAEFWLASDSPDSAEGEDAWGGFAPIVTGHEKEVPRVLPWRMFCLFAVVLSAAWILAGVYHILGATEAWDFDVPAWKTEAEGDQYQSDLLQVSSPKGKSRGPLSLLGIRGMALSRRDVKLPDHQQQMSPVWPHANVKPISLSCDANGQRFVATDGLLMYSATLSADPGSSGRMSFAELRCPGVAGEGLQDVAITCAREGAGSPEDCKVHVLHRHGRLLGTCQLNGTMKKTPMLSVQGARSGTTLAISDKWLEQMRGAAGPTAGKNMASEPHGRVEKAVTMTTDTSCADSSQEGCAFVGTNHGRLVRLRRRTDSSELLPTEVVHGRSNERAAGSRQSDRGALGPLGSGGRLGLLEENGGKQSLLILDAEKGGTSVGRLTLPPSSPAVAFCAGGGYLYTLLRGPSPAISWVPLPRELVR
mmetsp:Transcript_45571/g.132061  ORF Transcript_45571/g.132061 Transcript_45571/m.132061 type:complete len:934 (-) Transcript_45571:225-3026(-)